MENREVKEVSMRMMILFLVLQKDYISQTQLNLLTDEIMAKHHDGTIHVMYRTLMKEFYKTVKWECTDRFVNLVRDELSKIDRVDSVITLCDECPLIAYAFITEVKMIAGCDICRSADKRICNTVQSWMHLFNR